MTSPGPTSAVPLLRGALQWLFGTLFATSLIALFLVVNGVQLTSSGTAQRILSRATADLTESDAMLPTIQADLAEAAEASEEDTVVVPHFPLAVELPREEAATISTTELRSRLLSEAAEAIYRGLGFEVKTVDVSGIYQLGGALRCTVNVTRRRPSYAVRQQPRIVSRGNQRTRAARTSVLVVPGEREQEGG